MPIFPVASKTVRLVILGAVLLAGAARPGQAATLTFGVIQLSPDNPSNGLLSFVVSNISGPAACDATFNSCTTLIFNSGLLQVSYVDSVSGPQLFTAVLPDGFGPGDTDPSLFADFTVDPSTWTIGTVTFSGVLDPSSVFLFGGASATLQPATFSASFNAETDSFALLTTGAEPPTSAPEPGTWALIATGLAGVCGLQRRASRRTER